MRKILLICAFLVSAIAPAKAGALPEEYLGLWCFNTGFAENHGEEMRTEEKCHTGEYLKIQRNGYELNAADTFCKFISIKQIGKRYNLPRAPGILGPEVVTIHSVARCTNFATEETWTEKRELLQYSAFVVNKVLSKSKITPRKGEN
jgi:hypothetical protein